MKIITLLTLGILSGAGCAQTTPAPAAAVADAPTVNPAGVAETTVAERAVKTATGALVLVNEAEIRRLRANKEVSDSIVQAGTKQLDYIAEPVTVLAPGAHYDAKGVNPNATADKQLAADALVAYRAGLCYLITEDVRFAANAQRIIDAWATTLTDVTTRQGKFNVSSNMTFMILAASWVRDANGWDSSAFDKFLPAVILPTSTASATNNHGFWGVLMESSAYAYLGDKDGLNKARNRWNELMRAAWLLMAACPKKSNAALPATGAAAPTKASKASPTRTTRCCPPVCPQRFSPNRDSPSGKAKKDSF